MQTKEQSYRKYKESVDRMTIFCPEWRFGRFLAVNWSWFSSAKIVKRITGVMVDWQAFYDEFSGDKKACAHALWLKYKSDCEKIWKKVHSAN